MDSLMMANTLVLTPSQTRRLSPDDQSTPGPDDIDSPATPLANLGGALSWPIPLSADEQRRLRLITMSHAHHLGDQPLVMQIKGGVLEFLRYDHPIPENVTDDPAKMLDALLRSPQGQLMGKTLQQRMQGIDSDSSVMDYLLAGIALQMDPESITAPLRNKTAGLDLASNRHCGRHASAVIDDLAEHLSREGRTSAALAKTGAYLLLGRSAPQFLIADIPRNVKVGSLAWANLTMAAMAIEAQTPGKVPGLTFAQVMSKAESARRADPASTQRIQTAVLRDWAVTNEIILKRNDDAYTEGQLETIRATFNQELEERLAAARILDKALPTRKDIALALLIERFSDLGTLFEVKALHTDTYRGESGQTGFSGIHSLLDYAMMDLPNPRPLASSDTRLPLEALNNNPTFGVQEAFDRQFARSILDKKAAVNTTIRHMISLLPLEDKKNFEFGKVSFFQQGSFVSDGFFNHTPCPNEPGLLIRTELSGTFQAYEININKDTIERTALHKAKQQESREANKYFTTKELVPREAANELGRELALSESLVSSFSSARSRAIADTFVQHLDLDDPAIKELARGQTPMDEYYRPKPLGEFLLNLIPFRSAIVNFQKGNYGEAVFDLTVDVFGFLTAGVATAGKLIRIGRTALSTGAKALKTAHVIGVATIDVLNPVGGLSDLARLVGTGGLYLLSRGAKAVNRLRGTADSYDVLKALSKQYDAAATGTVKVTGQTVEGAAVLKSGQWYSFDADTMRPYGSPLEEFAVATQAVAGEVLAAHIDDWDELSHTLFSRYSVPDSRIAGLSRNSQGVYVAADGHLSHIRHTDGSGTTAVYEVRQVTRTEDGVVRARVYHDNRQTSLLVQHLQGDQWQRLGLFGGGQITADHLRAWEALPQAEQKRLTIRGFALQNGVSAKTFAYYVEPEGQLSAAGLLMRNRPANTPFNKVTHVHVRDWQTMTQPARDAMTMEGFAGHHHLNPISFKTYVRADGLGPAGETLLNRAAGSSYNALTDDHLRTWKGLFEKPDNSVTPQEFIREHGLSPNSWRLHVKVDGTLKDETVQRLDQARQTSAVPLAATPARLPARVPGGPEEKITAEHLLNWEAVSRNEQGNTSRADFARQHNLSQTTFEYYVQPDGQLSATGAIVRNRPANMPFDKVTQTHIDHWQNMTQRARDAMTMEGFAGHHHLHPGTFKSFVRRNGSLGPAGKALLNRATGTAYNAITDDHLREWSRQFGQPDNLVTAAEFVSQHGFSPTSWHAQVRANGSLRDATAQRLYPAGRDVALLPSAPQKTDAIASLPAHVPGRRSELITAEHLLAWEALPRAEQLSLTREGFTRQKGLSGKTFAYYVEPDGQLSAAGMIVRERPAGTPVNPVTGAHIRDWQAMTQPLRDAMTMEGFAGLHHLHPGLFKSIVRQNGSLAPAGEAMLNRAAGVAYNSIRDEHLSQWKMLFEKSGNTVTVEEFVRQHGLSPNSWRRLVRANGLLKDTAVRRLEQAGRNTTLSPAPQQIETSSGQKRPAQESVDPTQPKKSADTPQNSEQAPGPSSDILPVAIKVETGTSSSLPHQVDNTLPILQDPKNPRLSLTHALEGPIDDIRIAHWNGLLDGLDNASKKNVSSQIKESIKDWLRTEGQHQSRFDQTLEVFTALDDGPNRGASVWARRDIAKFEVLGPYAGKFHESDASLFQEIRKQGSRAVLTYLFGTRSGNRSVSGLHTGNTLSLINTSQLGNEPAWKSNNVISIAAGKNLTFYVALEDISKGDELLMDYGLLYQPVPDIAVKQDPGR
jgi:hypothetical protein